MRYWAYLAAKLAGAAAILFGLLALLNWAFPYRPNDDAWARLEHMGSTLVYDLSLMLWFLLCAAALYVIIMDQRYRCRVCLCRLRMPVETGSWGRMLQLGRPRIEYICPFGHGTLKAEELQISGLQNPEWKQNSDDFWEELCASGKDPGNPQ